MSSAAAFFKSRKAGANQFFPATENRGTILVASHIWWVDCIAQAINELGFNVFVSEPWYLLYTQDSVFAQFDQRFRNWIELIRKLNVQMVLGGNTSAIAIHPRTGELLHNAAGVPAVHYWWDEPRDIPAMCNRGVTLSQYLSALRDEHTLNAIWDRDVAEEMRLFFDVQNSIHVPLATLPDLWPPRSRPLADRATPVCFLGNCFAQAPGWEAGFDAAALGLARDAVDRKVTNLERSVTDCLREACSTDPVALEELFSSRSTAPEAAFGHWSLISMLLRERLRYPHIRALAERFGGEFTIVGKGWERLGLTAPREHSGVPGAADYYIDAKASLNLFGGCVHSGMPLRAFEIPCCGGLLFTQFNSELPDLFDPDSECVAFRDVPEMLTRLDHILSDPSAYDSRVDAARKRVLAEHTWRHRMRRVLDEAASRFNLPWK